MNPKHKAVSDKEFALLSGMATRRVERINRTRKIESKEVKDERNKV